MIWLYRLQQRLSITRREGLAVLTLTGLFLLGLGVRHVQEQRVPPITADSLTAPSSVQAAGLSSNVDAGPSPEDPLDLNDASAEALEALDGIGPTLADRILTYRRTQRPFQRVAELERVRGIGAKTLADLRPVVTVSSAGSQ